MKRRKIPLIGLFLLSQMVFSSNIMAQTRLDELVDFALKYSHDIKTANLKIEEASFQRKEAIGNGLPQVEATGSYSIMAIPEITISDDIVAQIPEEYAPMLAQLADIDNLYMASAGVQITQLLYSQAYWNGLKTTKKVQELNELLLNKTEEDLIMEVASEYYQAVTLILRLNAVNQSLENLNELYRIVELNYQNDLVKETDVSRLKVNITTLEANKETLINGYNNELNYIKALTGMPTDTTLVIDTTFLAQANQYRPVPEYTINNVADYQVLLKQNELNEQNIKQMQTEYMPTLAAYAKLNYASYSLKSELNDLSNTNTFGLQLKVPIFTSGVNYSKVQQAKIQQAQTNETILKTQDLLAINYNNAYSNYQTTYKLLQVQKENCDLANRVYQQTSLQFKEGMASMADVLNVNSDFIQASNNYSLQLIRFKEAEIKLLKTTGNLKQLVSK